MIRNSDDAVSPVVGVMLMLVVTIIIAAVVAAFAGGLGGEQKVVPQINIAAEGIVQNFADDDTTNYGSDYPAGFTAANGIMFENTGGDILDLGATAIQIQCGGTKYTITSADQLPASTCLPAGITNGGYFLKVGDNTLYDYTIAPGDKFMLYADNLYDNSGAAWASTDNGKYLVWHPDGVDGGFGAQFGKKLEYKIIDRDTEGVVASGYVFLRG